MNETLELKLQSWVDEELNASEAKLVEEQIARDAGAHQLVAELKLVTCLMQGAELPRTVPETREFYWSKIAREIERQSRGAQPAAARRPFGLRGWFSPFLGFASLACVLFLAVRPFSTPTFDEISATGEGMEAVTFHDQSAGMTVVWLSDVTSGDSSDVSQPAATPDSKTTTDSGDSDTEME